MKKLCTVLMVVSLFSWSFAQKGIEVGARGMIQSSVLINDADFAEDDDLNFEIPTWGQAFGIAAGYNFTDYMGVRTNALLSSYGQKYTGKREGGSWDDEAYSRVVRYQQFLQGSTTDEFNAEVKLKYIKLPVMLHVNSFPYNGAFFSFVVGPQLNLLSGATHYFEGNEVNYEDAPGSEYSTKDLYVSSHWSVVMGLGADISLTDLLKLNINFRFDYDLGDIEDKDFEYELLGQNVKFWNEDRPVTNVGSGGLMLGVTYVIQ